MLLEIKDLKVQYGVAEALKGVSLSIDRQSVITVVGANGAGKTTILNAISGLKKPASGEIWLNVLCTSCKMLMSWSGRAGWLSKMVSRSWLE